jgi:hypothetical protein
MFPILMCRLVGLWAKLTHFCLDFSFPGDV